MQFNQTIARSGCLLLNKKMDCYLAWNERAGLFVTLRNRSMEGAAILPTDQYRFAIVARVD